MAASVKALVKPELLVWARTSAHLRVDEAAHKAQVKEDQLTAWERGEGQPSIPQLRKLSRAYKRPLAVFYLPRPPRTFEPLRDFRRLPEGAVGQQSPELAYEIRRARYRRDVALDLYRELMGEDPQPFTLTATLDEDPEEVASRLRAYLGVTREEASGWRTAYEALNRWRSALEDRAVLVFQAEDVSVSEMRGFSISETVFPAVVVNMKDAPAARVFSMLHETTHLMLHDGGVCDALDETLPDEERAEVFCNRVAGATLVPAEWLLQEDVVRGQPGPRWSDETLMVLAQRYRVSREVVIRRLLLLGRTTEAFYKKKRRQLQAEFEAKQEEDLQKRALGLVAPGFVTPDRVAVSTAGPLFVRLVLNSYNQEKITSNDLSSFLEVRLKHVQKIAQAVLRRSMPPGATA
ncbi:MAG TPA: ImmA/IrrE family metallo-endopeptidase [Chromatiales bacterium]|nr:ImmA/IrrE family metallo-endopeptidase [Chromatiales bacterium]